MRTRSAATLVGAWQLDPQRSSIKFHVPHFWGLMTVKGHFDDYDGRLDLSSDPAIELTIRAASLQTGNRKRDEHLRSADFFDADREPRVRFVSDSVVPHDEGLRVRGSLSARGQSIPLELTARIRRVGEEFEIEAAAGAPHRDLGMTWNALGMIRSRSELIVSGYLVPA